MSEIEHDPQRDLPTAGVERGSPWWTFLLAGAAACVLGALVIDPSWAEAERSVAQLRIARGLLLVGAGGLVALWLLRRAIESDVSMGMRRWAEVPPDLSVDALVPTLGSRPQALLLWGLGLGWFLAMAVGVALRASWIPRMTFENGPLETLTVISYLAGFVFACVALWRLVGRSRRGLPRRWFLAIAALGCFLIAAEETDWGQTYLRYETPDTIEAANIQGDFSLHNLAMPDAIGVDRWANALLVYLGWALGGGVALLLVTMPPFRRLMWALDVPVPPWWTMAVLFAAACIPSIEVYPDRLNIDSELREVTIAVAVSVWMWTAWRRGASQTPGAEAIPSTGR